MKRVTIRVNLELWDEFTEKGKLQYLTNLVNAQRKKK
jgi:hypothetical protein